MKALIIGLELEEGGGGKEAIWFAEGESNAPKVETWEGGRAGVDFASPAWFCVRQRANQFSGWASFPLFPPLHRTQAIELVASRPPAIMTAKWDHLNFLEEGDATKRSTFRAFHHIFHRWSGVPCLKTAATFPSSAPSLSHLPLIACRKSEPCRHQEAILIFKGSK